MDRALFVAATGMAAQQRNLETIADNLANADVTGFKSSVAQFERILDGASGAPGLGTIAAGERLRFTQGRLEHSGGAYDCAIDGAGLFELRDVRGRTAYTRAGDFSLDDHGLLGRAGWHLVGVRLPANATGATIAADGTVSAHLPDGRTAGAGRIRLALFAAPEHLARGTDGLFFASPRAGRARLVAPAERGAGGLVAGSLERANVSVIEAMMEILTAQRAYEASAKGVSAADEMLRVANNLQRN
ncbi:flagellar hook-basal body protein [bacterium]|nr:MAG: flagellar hook-basal body protein [bacterium]